jgi:hypothetical protein
MNDRYFDGRKVSCFYWDGKVDYKREANKESEEEQLKRLEDFSEWIEKEPHDVNIPPNVNTPPKE